MLRQSRRLRRSPQRPQLPMHLPGPSYLFRCARLAPVKTLHSALCLAHTPRCTLRRHLTGLSASWPWRLANARAMRRVRWSTAAALVGERAQQEHGAWLVLAGCAREHCCCCCCLTRALAEECCLTRARRLSHTAALAVSGEADGAWGDEGQNCVCGDPAAGARQSQEYGPSALVPSPLPLPCQREVARAGRRGRGAAQGMVRGMRGGADSEVTWQ